MYLVILDPLGLGGLTTIKGDRERLVVEGEGPGIGMFSRSLYPGVDCDDCLINLKKVYNLNEEDMESLLPTEFLLTPLESHAPMLYVINGSYVQTLKCRDVRKRRYVSANYLAGAPPPLRLTIDCSDERVPYGSAFRSSDYNRNSRLDVDSFCSLIHNAFPKAVQDGKFILIKPDDQTGYSDTQVPISIAPPTGFISGLGIPKLKIPKLRIPSLNVPILKERPGPFKPPRIGSPMTTTAVMRIGEESSAEKMEKFKKGVQKMLHVVKVLGQIDQYLSERTRIIVEKLTKTFAE